MALNVELAKKAVAWCEAYPEKWNQEVFFRDLNTGQMCFGGVVMAFGIGGNYFGTHSYLTVVNELLGVGDPSHLLYRSANTLKDIKEELNLLAGEKLFEMG